MKSEIEKKLKYWEGQFNRAMDRFLDENSRKSRDEVIKMKERIKTYKECLALIK